MAESIISLMNKDHHLSLVDYVVVYGNEKLSELDTESVRITNLNEQKLVLQYKNKTGKSSTLSLLWNEIVDGEGVDVTSLSHVRFKLIAMAKFAANKQGFSPKQVKRILPPTSIVSVTCYLFAAVALATYFQNDFLRSGIGRLSLVHSPQLESFLVFWESKGVKTAVAMYVIHLVEMAVLTWPKAVKHRMPAKTTFAWMCFTFIEGYFQSPRLSTLMD